MNSNKIEKIYNFYQTCHILKNTIRAGWKLWDVQADRLESVAEHVYGTHMLAIAVAGEFDYDIDLQKVILMLAMHELEETAIGDLTPYDTDKLPSKTKNGEKAVAKILQNLVNGDQIKNLIFEFDKRETKEAKFAYMIDKLEADFQCSAYGNQSVNLGHFVNSKMMQTHPIPELYQKYGNKWSKLFIETDQAWHQNDYDDNFKAIGKFLSEKTVKQ